MEDKKNKNVDLERKRQLHQTIGLVISMALVTCAFEWQSAWQPVIDIPEPQVMDEILPDVPVTDHKPPKPKPVAIEIVEVKNEEEIDEEITFTLPTFDDPVEENLFIEEPEDEKPEEIILKAEVDPSFPGGLPAFYEYVSKHLKYPRQAIRNRVEGKVYVQFVVDTDGALSDLTILKGIGAACDEEALRVLQNSPRWNPGKQRGRAVKVRMTLPIIFKLQ